MRLNAINYAQSFFFFNNFSVYPKSVLFKNANISVNNYKIWYLMGIQKLIIYNCKYWVLYDYISENCDKQWYFKKNVWKINILS